MKVLYDKLRRYYRQIKMFTIRDGWRKAKWLKRHKIFAQIGENCYYAPNILPAEPFLVKLHNNVVISANVRIITHSAVHCVFNQEDHTKEHICPYGEVEIKDNVYIGANVMINYGVTIGRNCIIAAGAIVTKDVPDGEVWAGVPAKKIGLYQDVKEKSVLRSKQYDLSCVNGDTPVMELIKLKNEEKE